MQPGRACPVDYRYAPQALARAPALERDVVYVAGGVYGNAFALERIQQMAAAEAASVALVFNGDFNWFNADALGFERINAAVLRATALRGNVETEIAADDRDAGCGCAYPEWVSDAEVERSNAILGRLRETARGFPGLRAALRALPMYAVAQVGGVRVAIVHGDLHALAGWRYAQEALAAPSARAALAADFEAANVRVIASSHTCLPVAADCITANGRCVLANNGAAGMPNFRATRYGVVTRIARSPAPRALYGTRIAGVYVEALAVEYDHDRWIESFLRTWPPGSPAHASYWRRLVAGPPYEPDTAVRWSASRTAPA